MQSGTISSIEMKNEFNTSSKQNLITLGAPLYSMSANNGGTPNTKLLLVLDCWRVFVVKNPVVHLEYIISFRLSTSISYLHTHLVICLNMTFECYQWNTTTWPKEVTLLNISVNAVASCLEMHLNIIQKLPKHLKSRILEVAIKRGGLTNHALKSLIHADISELDLSESSVCNETLQIVSSCHSLQKLDINPGRNQQRNVSTEALRDLFPNVPHLSVLYMRRCKGVSDEVISTLVECCPLLRELDVGGCVLLTDNSLKKLKNLEYLNSLNISSSQVSDHGILELVEGNCAATLSELRLDSCQRISDFAIESIVMYCSNMKVLIFHGCPVTDATRFALGDLLNKSKVKQLTWTVY